MIQEERIVEYFRKHQEPLSRREIAEELDISENRAQRHLINLLNKGIITRIGGSSYSMWCLTDNTGGITVNEVSNLKTILNENVANAKGASEKLEEKMNEIENKLNKVYFDLVAIMGIFVAAFSLIVSNAERAYDIVQSEINIKEIIEGIIVSNVSTIVVVATLLWLMKHFFGIKKR